MESKISAKPVGVGAALQPWILAGERSLSLTHIATTDSVSLCARMKKLTAFDELESAIRLYRRDPRNLRFNDSSASAKK